MYPPMVSATLQSIRSLSIREGLNAQVEGRRRVDWNPENFSLSPLARHLHFVSFCLPQLPRPLKG